MVVAAAVMVVKNVVRAEARLGSIYSMEAKNACMHTLGYNL